MRSTLRASALAALALVPVAFVAALTATTPAAATGNCYTIKISSTAAVTTSGGGEATVAVDGLIMSTPEQASKVSYRHKLPAPVPFGDVKALSYRTGRLSSATGDPRIVAAYKLGVDINSDSTIDGVLVYEPLYSTGIVASTRKTHDPLAGKWWYSAEPGNRQTLATFEQWAAGTGPVAFPAPEVLWFGVEQGTYNAGAKTWINEVRFAGRRVCKLVRFGLVLPTVVPTRTATPTVTPVTTAPTRPPASQDVEPTVTPTRPSPAASSPSATSPADTSPSVTPPPPIGDDEDDAALPVTGSPVAYAAGIGSVLLAGGGVLLYTMRRRRTRYVA